LYKVIDEQDALKIVEKWNLIQLDTETTGRDAHLCNLLSVQFGNDLADTRIVVDCSTVDILLFKEVLESKRLIGQNLKFDLQFLYNYGIIPRKVYDTMIAEQVLYLGYPAGIKQYSLKAIAWDRLKIDIDKSIRGDIIWKGLSPDVIIYAAGDVTYLEQIMKSQMAEAQSKDCVKAVKLECDAVPAMAYLEWCGIMLDQEKWKAKMHNDQIHLQERLKALNEFVEADPYTYKDFVVINTQGDLFEGFDLSPKCQINWDSSRQVVQFCKVLGFDTTIQDKKTGEDKDSVLEKTLMSQKGINDEFLKLYFDYRESSKVVSTYGQGHLNAINPRTGRIHTTFKQIGASSGRMSCGSNQANTDLAKELHIPPSECKYPNLQQLPADETTRSAFVAPKGNLMVSADFSAEESRLGADIYQDKEFIKEFTEGSGDKKSVTLYSNV
jgi:DNA polymerase I-like protein with 3'-5' exonuclease and polymerase domains